MPFFILGAGSNLLFDDDGFDGVVIQTKKLNPGLLKIEDSVLHCGAATTVSKALRFSAEQGFSGLECLVGVPGSMGGVVAMNAGTHLGEVKNIFRSMEIFDLAEQVSEAKMQGTTIDILEADFSYRKNATLKFSQIILSVKLNLVSEPDKTSLQAKHASLLQKRKASQPIEKPSCGSVFKNPDPSQGHFAWKLIAEAGLRGHRIGDAQISDLHTNFIVNLGHASAADVKALIALAKAEVQKRTGLMLEEEVKTVSHRGTYCV